MASSRSRFSSTVSTGFCRPCNCTVNPQTENPETNDLWVQLYGKFRIHYNYLFVLSMYMYACTHIYIYMYTYIYICIYTCIGIHYLSLSLYLHKYIYSYKGPWIPPFDLSLCLSCGLRNPHHLWRSDRSAVMYISLYTYIHVCINIYTQL